MYKASVHLPTRKSNLITVMQISLRKCHILYTSNTLLLKRCLLVLAIVRFALLICPGDCVVCTPNLQQRNLVRAELDFDLGCIFGVGACALALRVCCVRHCADRIESARKPECCEIQCSTDCRCWCITLDDGDGNQQRGSIRRQPGDGGGIWKY